MKISSTTLDVNGKEVYIFQTRITGFKTLKVLNVRVTAGLYSDTESFPLEDFQNESQQRWDWIMSVHRLIFGTAGSTAESREFNALLMTFAK